MGPSHHRLRVATVVALVAGVCLASPTSAFAATAAPTTPTNEAPHATATSFSVVAHSKHAKQYKLFASTNKQYLAVSNLSHAKASKASTSPNVKITGLKYAAQPYYYRLEAINPKHHAFGTVIGAVNLMPSTPTNLQANATDAGVFLTWNSGPATGYRVVVGPAQFDNNDRPVVYTIRGQETQFSPPNLTMGTSYLFTVQALNGTTPSAPALLDPSDAFTPVTQQQPITVGTYNILEAVNGGLAEGDGTIAPWEGTLNDPTAADSPSVDRIFGVANSIEEANPAVVAIEEGASWTRGTQANDNEIAAQTLVDQLNSDGGSWALANTEVDPPNHPLARTGVNILYQTNLVQPVGTGGNEQIGVEPGNSSKPRYMAYQEFQVVTPNTSNADFLFVASHLAVGNGSIDGTNYDQERQQETYEMIHDTQDLQQANPVNGHQLPVVYAGDYNSAIEASHPLDGPGDTMRGQGNDDAYTVAPVTSNGQYNSANNYFRTAPLGGIHIDYVWTTGGVATTKWTQTVDLTNGKFVGVIPSDHNLVTTAIQLPYTP